MPSPETRLRVALVTPTFFSPDSYIGGGERYVDELARALAERVDVRLVSFGRAASREWTPAGVERVILRSWTRQKMTPFSPRLARELRGADVVHAFQYFTLPTFLSCWLGKRHGSRVFVTDLGGGGWTPGYHLDQSCWIDAHLPISQYATRGLPGRKRPWCVIHGGVDPERYAMRPSLTHDGSVVFLGRILPHKGVHFLVEGLPSGIPLHVVGPVGDVGYLERLHKLASGKAVTFHHELSDDQVIALLQRAMALVHPTPVDERGEAGAAELFGLALVEAMACGCPVIASRAASLPEIVEDGTTGFLVEPNRPAAIGVALEELRASSSLWQAFSSAGRARTVGALTWQIAAEKARTAYKGLFG